MTIPSTAKSFVLKQSAVTGVNLKLGEPTSTFELVERPIRELKPNEVLVRTLYLSNDPTQRAWIQKGIDPERMYVPPVLPGQLMRASGLGRVIKSTHKEYKEGDVLACTLNWQDYCIVKADGIYNKVPDLGLPLTLFLDTVGMTGLTAYFGLLDVAKLKATDTIVISAASGATGSVCVQIAKNVIGCKRVIGISGGPDKCKYVESLGADVCVDYKSKTFSKDLRAAISNNGADDKYCDVYFDGVGGAILDKMLTLVKPHGTVVACGAIAGYDDFRAGFVRNWGQIITNRIQVKGFIIIDYAKQYAQGVADILRWIKEGKIRVGKDTFSLVDLSKNDADFSKIPEAWGILFSDKKGPGKLLTKL
ncbi:Enoyl reductase (ER) domain-containing protein [[Candida] zeylanoides]